MASNPHHRDSFGASVDAYRRRFGIARPGAGADPAQRLALLAADLAGISAYVAGRGLMDHQVEAVKAVADRIAKAAEPESSIRPLSLVVIPTAGGKTRAFQTIVSALSKGGRGGRRRMPNVVVLVPTKVLVRQTCIEFAANFPDVEYGHLASAKLRDEYGGLIPEGPAPTTVMTYAAFMQDAESGKIRPEDVDLLVMDEAHRGLSDLRQATLQPFLRDCAVTAWTATPAFDEEKNVHNLLGPDSEVYRISPEELRRRRVIAPIVNYVVAVRIEGEMPAGRREAAEIRRRALVKVVMDFVEDRVEHGLGAPGEPGIDLAGKVAVFYGADRAHAKMFAAEYNARFEGRKHMEVLTGDDSAERIRSVIADLAAGRITAVANSMLLVEGFDVPKIGLVVNSSTGSKIKVLQQSGRMQRLDRSIDADSPEQTSFVIDTYYRINDRVLGRPRFVFEALGDYAIAHRVESPAIAVDELRAGPARRGDGRLVEPGPLRRGDYRVFHEISSVVRMLRERDDGAAPPPLAPPKDDGMLSFHELAKAVRPDEAGKRLLWSAFAAAEAAHRTAGQASYGGIALAGGMRSESGRELFCLATESAESLARACGTSFFPVRAADGDDLGLDALAEEIGVSSASRTLRALWADLDEAMRARCPFALRDGPVEAALVDDGRRRFIAVSRADAGRFAAHLAAAAGPAAPPLQDEEPSAPSASAPPWEADYLDPTETAVGGRLNTYRNKHAWGELMADVRRGVDHGLRVARMRKGDVVGYFLHRDDLAAFADRYLGPLAVGSTIKTAGNEGPRWPLPDLLDLAQARFALCSPKRDEKAFTEAWRICTQAWSEEEPARPFGLEIRGRAFEARAGRGRKTRFFYLEKASLAEFGKLADALLRARYAPKAKKQAITGEFGPEPERFAAADFARALGGSRRADDLAAHVFAELEKSWRAKGTATYRRRRFPTARLDGEDFTVGAADIDALASAVGGAVVSRRPAGRLGLDEVRARLGVTIEDAPLLEFPDVSPGCSAELTLADGGTVVLRREQGGWGSGPVTIAEQDVPRLAAHLDRMRRDVPEWNPDYVPRAYVAAHLDADPQKVGTALGQLQRALRLGETRQIRAGPMRLRGEIKFCVHFEDIPKVLRRVAEPSPAWRTPLPRPVTAKKKEVEYLTEERLARALGVDRAAPAFVEFWQHATTMADHGSDGSMDTVFGPVAVKLHMVVSPDDPEDYDWVPAVARPDLPKIKAATVFGMEKFAESWSYSREEARTALDVPQRCASAFDAVWDACERAWIRGMAAEVNGVFLFGTIDPRAGGDAFRLDALDGPSLSDLASAVSASVEPAPGGCPTWTPDYFEFDRLARQAAANGCGDHRAFAAAWDAFAAAWRRGMTPGVRAGVFDKFGREIFCIHRGDLDRMIALFDAGFDTALEPEPTSIPAP